MIKMIFFLYDWKVLTFNFISQYHNVSYISTYYGCNGRIVWQTFFLNLEAQNFTKHDLTYQNYKLTQLILNILCIFKDLQSVFGIIWIEWKQTSKS